MVNLKINVTEKDQLRDQQRAAQNGASRARHPLNIQDDTDEDDVEGVVAEGGNALADGGQKVGAKATAAAAPDSPLLKGWPLRREASRETDEESGARGQQYQQALAVKQRQSILKDFIHRTTASI